MSIKLAFPATSRDPETLRRMSRSMQSPKSRRPWRRDGSAPRRCPRRSLNAGARAGVLVPACVRMCTARICKQLCQGGYDTRRTGVSVRSAHVSSTSNRLDLGFSPASRVGAAQQLQPPKPSSMRPLVFFSLRLPVRLAVCSPQSRHYSSFRRRHARGAARAIASREVQYWLAVLRAGCAASCARRCLSPGSARHACRSTQRWWTGRGARAHRHSSGYVSLEWHDCVATALSQGEVASNVALLAVLTPSG